LDAALPLNDRATGCPDEQTGTRWPQEFRASVPTTLKKYRHANIKCARDSRRRTTNTCGIHASTCSRKIPTIRTEGIDRCRVTSAGSIRVDPSSESLDEKVVIEREPVPNLRELFARADEDLADAGLKRGRREGRPQSQQRTRTLGAEQRAIASERNAAEA